MRLFHGAIKPSIEASWDILIFSLSRDHFFPRVFSLTASFFNAGSFTSSPLPPPSSSFFLLFLLRQQPTRSTALVSLFFYAYQPYFCPLERIFIIIWWTGTKNQNSREQQQKKNIVRLARWTGRSESWLAVVPQRSPCPSVPSHVFVMLFVFTGSPLRQEEIEDQTAADLLTINNNEDHNLTSCVKVAQRWVYQVHIKMLNMFDGVTVLWCSHKGSLTVAAVRWRWYCSSAV